MIKAERNKICSRKQTRMLFLAGVVLIVAYFFFFQFNYQNVFYDYDLEKMALASGFTAIEQRKEVAEIFEGKMFFISVILNIFGIVALTTITLFLSAQMSSPVTALITSCVICFLPVVFDFNDSLPVLQKMQEICPIFMLHTNGIFSDMKTYFGMSQPVFMIILNVGLIFVFYRLTKNISKKHQVTG